MMGGTSQILMPKGFDFTNYQNQLQEQYSNTNSQFSSGATVTTQTNSIDVTMTGSDGSVMMNRYTEYSPNGVLVKATVETNFNGSSSQTETDLLGDYTTIPL